MAPIPFPHAGYTEDVFKRVRVLFGGQYVADAQTPKLVWENAFYPYYYFPKSDVKSEYLKNPTSSEKHAGATVYDLVVGDSTAPGAVTVFGDKAAFSDKDGSLAGYVKIAADAAAWFEENDRFFGHPRDPYKRITILSSSKHVRVEIEGVEVANTRAPRRLYETGLPIRTYIPFSDVRLDLLTDAPQTSYCPYKGEANYFDVNLPSGKKSGLVWWYKSPLIESADIKGLIAFYDEKVDIWVDGVKQERAVTHFATRSAP